MEKRLTTLTALEIFLEEQGNAPVANALPVAEPDAGAVRGLFERLDRFVEMLRFRNFVIALACC